MTLLRLEGFSFWRFSLRTYRAPGVEKACLALQDDCGADVNLLLYCCWTGLSGRRLSARAVRSARAAVARWQSGVVSPLRRARRAIRKGHRGVTGEWAGQLRRRISAAELDAEYVEQSVLAAHAAGMPPSARKCEPREAAAANLKCYLDLLGAPIGRREARNLRTLLEAGASPRM
jgi:uncharacterized protein (TIGR02444 family)